MIRFNPLPGFGVEAEQFLHHVPAHEEIGMVEEAGDPAVRLLLMSYELLAVDRRVLTEEALDKALKELAATEAEALSSLISTSAGPEITEPAQEEMYVVVRGRLHADGRDRGDQRRDRNHRCRWPLHLHEQRSQSNCNCSIPSEGSQQVE